MNDSDKFFQDKGSESRPRAVNPETGREQSWQRASNYAAPLDNPHSLIKWQLRELIKGLSLRPDLARMLLTGAAIEDNGKADEIIASAHAVAATDARANEGTAVHAALSRAFLGHETPAEYIHHVSAFADELRRNDLEPVATEVTLLCVKLGVIGHGDWIVRTADGRYLILDVKSGSIKYPNKFAVQCIAYAQSEWIDNGKGGWVKIPFDLDRTEAVLAHVDPETGATSLYRVDLQLGLYGATLAERVRDWGKVNVLSPYVPALTPQRAQNRGQVDAVAVGTRVDPTQPGSEVVTAKVAAEYPDLYRPDGVPTPAVPAEVPATEQPGPIAQGQALNATVADELNALMTANKTKPEMQRVAGEHGCRDLAHNREWLAYWVIAKRRGMDDASCVLFAKSKGDVKIGTAASYSETPANLEPSPENELAFVFKAIEGAKSEGALLALQQNIVERRGDQAWTDDMAVAARRKVDELLHELLHASGNADHARDVIRQRIAAATEPKHIADLWSEVTLGGSAQDRWEQFRAAADARMAEIQRAQPAPPANPYGP